jgi:hypothetical protein
MLVANPLCWFCHDAALIYIIYLILMYCNILFSSEKPSSWESWFSLRCTVVTPVNLSIPSSVLITLAPCYKIINLYTCINIYVLPLNILNGLVHLSVWTKSFIIFSENFIQCTDCDRIANSADDDDKTAQMSQLIMVCTGCMSTICCHYLRAQHSWNFRISSMLQKNQFIYVVYWIF